MPTPYIQKIAKETGMKVAELEKKWDEAKTIAAKKHKESEQGFYGIVVSIFKNMLGDKVSENQLVEIVDSFYISEEGEGTTSSDIAQPDKMLGGRPLFRVDNDMFNKIGFTARHKHGWYQNFYGTKVGEWCKNNKGKSFVIENEKGWLLEVNRDRFKTNEKEITLDEETFGKRKTNR